MAIKVLRVDRDFVKIPLVKGGFARGVIWPGMGAKYAGMNYFVMKPGEENVPHIHERSENIFYVIQGRGLAIDGDAGIEHPIEKGCVVYVQPRTTHMVRSLGPKDYISVDFQCPPDLKLYERLKVKP